MNAAIMPAITVKARIWSVVMLAYAFEGEAPIEGSIGDGVEERKAGSCGSGPELHISPVMPGLDPA
ncbi:hypothetical protein AGR3A_Lc60005 [Agrobacterium tomkonis CFBP 6623]|uniref:Uncharacterized protein n=1 Tax=Agrobacterium tomkonis CFBP 6623 TaxID=1183432 RepID=A0A1S7S5Q0_9HYPH|nr:hypothetical protein AGR3A_Lc60005 [Agrobacterium tomkonis CFBP 6623]